MGAIVHIHKYAHTKYFFALNSKKFSNFQFNPQSDVDIGGELMRIHAHMHIYTRILFENAGDVYNSYVYGGRHREQQSDAKCNQWYIGVV